MLDEQSVPNGSILMSKVRVKVAPGKETFGVFGHGGSVRACCGSNGLILEMM